MPVGDPISPMGYRLPNVREPDDDENPGHAEILVFDWWAWYSEPASGRGNLIPEPDDQGSGDEREDLPVPDETWDEPTPGAPVLVSTYSDEAQIFDPSGVTDIEVLVVGAGGNGGAPYRAGHPTGGGGGGGVVHIPAYDVTFTNDYFDVKVGLLPRQDSVFGEILLAKGGGNGTAYHPDGSERGGSGGGAYGTSAVTHGGDSTQQRDFPPDYEDVGHGAPGGGRDFTSPYLGSGGGGGAGGAGGRGSNSPSGMWVIAGSGGDDYKCDITGTMLGYGGGGGGAWYPFSTHSASGGAGGGSTGGHGAWLRRDSNGIPGPVSGAEPEDGVSGRGGGGGGACLLEDENGVWHGYPGKGGSGTVITRIDLSSNPGTPVRVGDYICVTYTDSGHFEIPAGITTVEVLVVGAGGAGGVHDGSGLRGGGGGGGGVIHLASYGVTGTYVPVFVGRGGIASERNSLARGQHSRFGDLRAHGGGVGAGTTALMNPEWIAGGSGGGGVRGRGVTIPAGATVATGSESGNRGGINALVENGLAGGGGGAGSEGDGGTAGVVSGHGGRGISVSITGTPVTYASGGGAAGEGSGGTARGSGGRANGGDGTGGGGDGYQFGVPATSGQANTGGGGGGGAESNPAGDGGSGIVIVRYYDPL